MEVSNTYHDYFGNTKLPRGLRFYPFDVELVLSYLKKKVYRRTIEDNIIGELDVYAFDPEELPGQSLWKSRDRQWFFFSHIIRRNPNGGRAIRTTKNGYWKVTGDERCVTACNRRVGVIKTLVFYRGRAPGKRTDWVMHEYTLSKEEIKRCRATPDPYVLYKLYQKSGRGPRNGEQYGAPVFIEEEWIDEDEPVEAMQPANVTPSDDSIMVSDQNQLLVKNDIEEIHGQIADHPIVDQPGTSETPQVLNQVGLNTVLDRSLEDKFSTEQGVVSQTSGQHYVAQASSEITSSCDAPKVTIATNISEQVPCVTVEDCLELDDLSDLRPSFMEMDKPSETLHPREEVNGWDEHDLYFDAAMFLRDLGHGTLEDDISHLNYPLLSHTDDTSSISSELWTPEQRPTAPGYDGLVAVPPNSGSSTTILIEAREDQGGTEGVPQGSSLDQY